ncbi:MAG: DUF2079 domain-containing protein [Thermoplasmata archaeon]|nr:DUF2079 domain-containing protein [Thermoplasmata archaeon]
MAIALAALLESAALTWVQAQNYLGFHATQGDLGNYNQAFFTTVHRQGFFYYTTNIPGGSGGSLWAIHFSPTLMLLLPFYALVPSPITLIALKQLALSFAALPVYGIAKAYFRKGPTPILFAGLYLLSPLTFSVDWNNFDPEALLPLLTLTSLYFFTKGRFWPFLAFWILALGTIEAAPPLLLLFAGGGLVGTLLWPSTGPYWSAARQRRPLLLAAIVTLAWIGLSFLELQLAGPRGGAFGDAYATRYSVLGATSLPDVLPHAISHPGAAGAALQYGGSEKVLFLELLLLATGGVSILAGLRYLLPLSGYLVLAFLSNNPSLYVFGTQYAALISGLLFAAGIEGAMLVYELLGSTSSEQRLKDRSFRFVRQARALLAGLPAWLTDESDRLWASARLQKAIRLLGQGELGRAEHLLERVQREVEAAVAARENLSLVRRVRRVVLGAPRPPGRSRTNLLTLRAWQGPDVVAFAIVAVFVLAAASVANPLLRNPLDAGTAITYGLAGPNPDDQALHTVLGLIPPEGSVLTTSHVFPELSSRHDAFVVVNGAFLRGNETIAGDLNAWANQSNYVALDYHVDPAAAVFYRYYTNLSSFGLYASEDGACLYERGWQSGPSYFAPWSSSWAGGQLVPGLGSPSGLYSSSQGPSFFHPAGGHVHDLLWSGPRLLYLPPGNYTATFTLELMAPNPGAQVEFQATAMPASVQDQVILTTAHANYHMVGISPGSAPTIGLGQTTLRTTSAENAPTEHTVSLSFSWNGTGYVNFPGLELSTTMSLYLVSVAVTQQSGLP